MLQGGACKGGDEARQAFLLRAEEPAVAAAYHVEAFDDVPVDLDRGADGRADAGRLRAALGAFLEGAVHAIRDRSALGHRLPDQGIAVAGGVDEPARLAPQQAESRL